jgi:hypothetical protein
MPVCQMRTHRLRFSERRYATADRGAWILHRRWTGTSFVFGDRIVRQSGTKTILFNFLALLMLERGVGTHQPPFRPHASTHKDGPVIDMFWQTYVPSQSLTQVLLDVE